jgi:hypothetical protein
MRFSLLIILLFLLTNLTSQSVIVISDSLVIEKPTTYTNTTFECCAGAVLLVKGNATLTIQHCKFYSAEKYLWKGIEVRENANLVMRGSHIQDAQYAVHIGPLNTANPNPSANLN